MRSILTIMTPADDLALLTIDELRVAAGITGSGSDPSLKAMGLRIAASIVAECGIAIGRGAEPTLRQEIVSETFYEVKCGELVLARRHNIEVASVTVDGSVLDPGDVDVDPESGIAWRLSDEQIVPWGAKKAVFIYKAGFEDIPGDLKMAATDFFRMAWLESTRDPALKGEVVDIPDVIRTEKTFWVGSVPGQSLESAVPDVVAGQLGRFRNIAIG